MRVIFQGKTLADSTTLEDNKIVDNTTVIIVESRKTNIIHENKKVREQEAKKYVDDIKFDMSLINIFHYTPLFV